MQDLQTGDISFYLKGADVVMSPIVQYTDWLDEEVGNMAREGLRTLVVARKVLTEDQYLDFEVLHIIHMSLALFYTVVVISRVNIMRPECALLNVQLEKCR